VQGKEIHRLSKDFVSNDHSIFGRTIPNAVADKVGHFNVMIVMSAFTMALILGLWLPAAGNTAIITFAALFGIGSGAGISLTPALCAKISRLSDIGTPTGAAYSIAAIAALTGSPIGGKIVTDGEGSFKYTIVFGGICCAMGTIFFVATRGNEDP
jgi:predicted MFS family arabinose efflux permease